MTDEARATLRITVCAALASVLTSMLLFSVVRGGDWFGRALGLIALVTVVGAALRAVRVPRPLIICAQALLGFFYLVAMYASEPAFAGVVPLHRRAWDRLYDVIASGFNAIDAQTPPVVATPGTTFIVVAGVGIMALLVDALAVSYRQAALAGLPLLVMYTVPAAVLPHGLRGWMFLLPACGYLVLLLTESRHRMLTWGVPIATRGAAAVGPVGGRAAGDLNRMSRRIGVIVLGLAIVVPAISPGVTAGAFGSNGIGHQSGGKTISTLNPLVEPAARPRPTGRFRRHDREDGLVQAERALPAHRHPRHASTGRSGRRGDVRSSASRRTCPRSSGFRRTSHSRSCTPMSTISERLASDYLPMPFPTRKVTVPGQWRVDPLTGNVVSHKGRKQITGVGYNVSSIDLLPNKFDVSDQEPEAPYLQSYLLLPEDLPSRVTNLAARVTRDAKGPLAKATALQRWFRDPRNFTYDLQTRAGTGKSAILAFLDDKSGYCEQFASTMAVMARAIGIPARVNVGFTSGKLSSDGEYRTISSHDAHAWPELYMPGVGWTRFEPTPGSATSSPSVPSWLAQDEKPEPEKPKPTTDEADSSDEDSEPSKWPVDQHPARLHRRRRGLQVVPGQLAAPARRLLLRRWGAVGQGRRGGHPAPAARDHSRYRPSRHPLAAVGHRRRRPGRRGRRGGDRPGRGDRVEGTARLRAGSRLRLARGADPTADRRHAHAGREPERPRHRGAGRPVPHRRAGPLRPQRRTAGEPRPDAPRRRRRPTGARGQRRTRRPRPRAGRAALAPHPGSDVRAASPRPGRARPALVPHRRRQVGPREAGARRCRRQRAGRYAPKDPHL